jgi:hypothetical protein
MARRDQRVRTGQIQRGQGPIQLTLVDPLVIEAAADVARSGESFGHPSGAQDVERLHTGTDSLPTCNTLMTPRGGTLGVAELAAEGSQRGGPGRS